MTSSQALWRLARREIAIKAEPHHVLPNTFFRSSDVDRPRRNQWPGPYSYLPATWAGCGPDALCVICAGGLAAHLCVLIGFFVLISQTEGANPGFTKVITVFARRKSKSTGNTVLFVGASDAGKTAILSSVSHQRIHRVGGNHAHAFAMQLAFHQQLSTHASLQTNSSLIALPKKRPVQAVDIPGHPRIRVQYRDYFNDAKVVVFVVDTSTVSRNGAAVAEYVLLVLRSIFHFFHGLIDALRSRSSTPDICTKYYTHSCQSPPPNQLQRL